MAQGQGNPANGQLVKGSGSGTKEWREDFVLTDTDGSTPLFKVERSTGNVTGGTFSTAGVVDNSGNAAISGTLGVSGASTLAAVSATTLAASGDSSLHAVAATTVAASGLVTSTVAAGSPVLKFILTNATPTVAFTDSGSANHAPTTAPAGYLQIVVGSTPYYIPVWA
jgi:hypothetical protein